MPAAPKTRKQPRPTMTHLEPAEVLSVLKAAKAKGAREWAMIVVAYKHGMRASEVCNLRLDDVDFKNGSIVVERLKGSLRTTQAVTEHRGEPLLNEYRALREWWQQRRDDGSDFLFTSQKGGRLDRSQFFRLFQAIIDIPYDDGTAALIVLERILALNGITRPSAFLFVFVY